MCFRDQFGPVQLGPALVTLKTEQLQNKGNQLVDLSEESSGAEGVGREGGTCVPCEVIQCVVA